MNTIARTWNSGDTALCRQAASVLCTDASVRFGLEPCLLQRVEVPDGTTEIISILRRLALSILRQDTTLKDSIRGKRLIAGWSLNNLKRFLLAFQAH